MAPKGRRKYQGVKAGPVDPKGKSGGRGDKRNRRWMKCAQNIKETWITAI